MTKYALNALFTLVLTALALGFSASNASASDKGPILAVAKACPGSWEEQACLSAVSNSTLIMSANYAETLDKKGESASMELVKEHCSAATAATKGEYPAEAMRSAYVECVNTLVDIHEKTNIKPDPTYYQALIGAVMCLDKTPSCSVIEMGLKSFR